MSQRAAASWNRALLWWSGLLVLLVVVLAFCVQAGSTPIDLWKALGLRPFEGETNFDRQILFVLRLPRVLFGAIAGGGLALAGAVYQALLRNDLAEPYTLGIAGGASFGALLMMNAAPAAMLFWMLPTSAFLFGGVAVLVIYALARWRSQTTSPSLLILAGVTLNLLFAAGILAVQYLSDPHQAYAMIRWLMGGVDVDSLRPVWFVGGIVLFGGAILLWNGRNLNVLCFGEMTASHLGVNVERSRLVLLFTSSIMAAGIVAYAGPIGFVGLIVPHALRRMAGADHRLLLPAVGLAGASFLVICDTIARTAASPTEIPVGIITAFLGGPFFLFILFRHR